jgi:hypothetical protein
VHKDEDPHMACGNDPHMELRGEAINKSPLQCG